MSFRKDKNLKEQISEKSEQNSQRLRRRRQDHLMRRRMEALPTEGGNPRAMLGDTDDGSEGPRGVSSGKTREELTVLNGEGGVSHLRVQDGEARERRIAGILEEMGQVTMNDPHEEVPGKDEVDGDQTIYNPLAHIQDDSAEEIPQAQNPDETREFSESEEDEWKETPDDGIRLSDTRTLEDFARDMVIEILGDSHSELEPPPDTELEKKEEERMEAPDEFREIGAEHRDPHREAQLVVPDNNTEMEHHQNDSWTETGKELEDPHREFHQTAEEPCTERRVHEIGMETEDPFKKMQRVAEEFVSDHKRQIEHREEDEKRQPFTRELHDNTKELNWRMELEAQNDPVRELELRTHEDHPREVTFDINQRLGEEEQEHPELYQGDRTEINGTRDQRPTIDIILERIFDYLHTEVDLWKTREENPQVLHRLENFESIIRVIPINDPGWMEMSEDNDRLDERRAFFNQLIQIRARRLLPDTALLVQVRTADNHIHRYTLNSITDDGIFETRKDFEDNYDARRGKNQFVMQPLAEIIEVSLVVDHEKINEDTARHYRLQGNFFPFFLDPRCAELSEFMEKLEIFTEDKWQPKENCFFKALEHWNDWKLEIGDRANVIPDETMKKIKWRLRGNGMTKTLIRRIALDFNLSITVSVITMYQRKGVNEINHHKPDEYNEEGQIKVQLGLFMYHNQGHYIANIDTEFTEAGVKHYHELRAYKNTQYDRLGRPIRPRSLEERISVDTVKADGSIEWKGEACKMSALYVLWKMMEITDESTVKGNPDHRFFIEIPNYMLYRGFFKGVNTKYVTNIDIEPRLDPDMREVMYHEKSNEDIIYVADTECQTEGRHKPYAIAFCPLGAEDKMKTYLGEDCIEKFCDDMQVNVVGRYVYYVGDKNKRKGRENTQNRKVIVYFHNLSYDGRMFADQNIVKITMAANRIIEMVIEFEYQFGDRTKKKWMHLRDSYLLIPSKLANFPSMFDTNEKEKKAFPYDFVTIEMVVNNGLIENNEIKKVKAEEIINSQVEKGKWKEQDVTDFMKVLNEDFVAVKKKNSIENVRIYNNDTDEVDIRIMVQNYVESDVRLLSQGMVWFKQNMQTALGLDMTNYLSISAVAFDYFKREAFTGENICEYTGEVRDFIRQAVYGGRCMTRGNNAFKMVNARILDIDACSLYPSAMSVMDIPKGMPKKLENLDRYELERRMSPNARDHIDAVIVRIRIKAIGRTLQFPLICERDKKGVVVYDNFVNAELVVDDIQLKEMIKWQQIDYDIIEGIYWNEGVSTKINDKIKEIYERRREAKAQTPPNKIEQIYKLIMNSSYGKCIEMTKPYKCHIVKSKDYLNHLFQNYTNIVAIDEIIGFDGEQRRAVIEDKILNNIASQNELSELSEIEKKTKFIFREYLQYDNFYVPAMVGVRILSYSKKLMNEVMVPAELDNILIFYQDTDSMHVLECQEEQLQLAWRKHNHKGENEQLYGSNMCQFHSDFEKVNGKEAVSHSSIFLGKKMYLDVLTPRYENTNEFKMMTRMKGISKESLEKYEFTNCPNLSMNEKIWKIYDDLFNGHSLTFELVVDKTKMEFTRNLEVRTITSFKRKVNPRICTHWEFDENGNWKKTEMMEEEF